MKKPKNLPKDANKRALEIVRLSTEEPEEPKPEEQPTEPIKQTPERSAISEYLATIGRKGGLKGGNARKEKLTPEQRSEIAKKAATMRWKKENDKRS